MSKLDFHGGRKKKDEESAVLEATLAQLKLSLSWSWAKADQLSSGIDC